MFLGATASISSVFAHAEAPSDASQSSRGVFRDIPKTWTVSETAGRKSKVPRESPKACRWDRTRASRTEPLTAYRPSGRVGRRTAIWPAEMVAETYLFSRSRAMPWIFRKSLAFQPKSKPPTGDQGRTCATSNIFHRCQPGRSWKRLPLIESDRLARGRENSD